MMTFSEFPGMGPAPPVETLGLITDALAWPLLVLRRDSSLVHANLAGQRLLERRRPLTINGKRVVAPTETALRSEYQAAQSAALQAGAGRPPQILLWATPAWRISVSMAALDGPAPGYPLLLLALSPDPGRLADLHAYAAINGLSEAETRVLLHLARGDSSAAAAAELGVSAATVRSQTVALRRKTGHANVGALMRTLASLPPLVPDDEDGQK